ARLRGHAGIAHVAGLTAIRTDGRGLAQAGAVAFPDGAAGVGRGVVGARIGIRSVVRHVGADAARVAASLAGSARRGGAAVAVHAQRGLALVVVVAGRAVVLAPALPHLALAAGDALGVVRARAETSRPASVANERAARALRPEGASAGAVAGRL